MPKQYTALFISLFFFCLLFPSSLYSETTISISDLPVDVIDIDLTDMQEQVQDLADLNGPNVADAFAFSNILGYPIGKSYLGGFPHFEFGVSAGAGCTNMKYFDENDPASDNGSLPVFAPNAVVHAGIGFAKGIDFLGKFFYFSKSLRDPGVDYDLATLSDIMIYSVGGKIRFNYIKKKTMLPFLLSFGGITFSIGGDFMYGDIDITGEYDFDFDSISMEFPAPVGNQDIDILFEGQYAANIHWSIFAITFQAIAYIDIFYFFSLYSGFGLTGGFGFFSLGFDGTGSLTTDSTVYQTINGSSLVGTLRFETENEYRPSPVIPSYIIGLEINLFVLKLNLETMVNMNNRSDVNAQIGTRIEI